MKKKIFKRTLSALLAVVMVFLMIPFSVFAVAATAYSGACGENLTWSLNTDTGVLTISGTGAMENYSGETNPWYNYRSFIKTVEINNGVTSIGDYAFEFCSGLTGITIPSSVTTIGDSAFLGCSGLTSITIPNSVTTIGNSAFQSSNLTSIVIPNSVTSIGIGAFFSCIHLTSIIIPNSVKSIGTGAFGFCSCYTLTYCGTEEEWNAVDKESGWNDQGPEKVWFHDYVDGVCTACGTVTGTCGENLTWSLDSGILTISGTGDMADYSSASSLRAPWDEFKDEITVVVISNGVTSIGDYAFYDFGTLPNIGIPSSVVSIGDSAFYYCDSLKRIEIPQSVTEIGSYAFYNCSELESVILSDGLMKIGGYAFKNCSAVTKFVYCGSASGWTTVSKGINWDYNMFSEVQFHDFDNGVITTEPTHMTEGVKTFTCPCGESYTESVEKLSEHTNFVNAALNMGYVNGEVVAMHYHICECGAYVDAGMPTEIYHKDPTHTEPGEKIFSCDTCNQWIGLGSLTIPCLPDHEWDNGVITTAPTYTTEGVKTFTCPCGESKTEAVAKLEITEDSPKITVESKNANVGQTVTVPIILRNNPGVSSMRITVTYNGDVLKLTNVAYNAAMGGQSVAPENIDALDGSVILYWVAGFSDYTEDCVFATLTFAVSDEAVSGESTVISVDYDEEDIFDAEEENVTFFCEEGIISFRSHIPGDINGDGSVTTKDVTRLMKYLADWDVEVNEAALDVNGDGQVTTKDTTRLMKYLAGWGVEIF